MAMEHSGGTVSGPTSGVLPRSRRVAAAALLVSLVLGAILCGRSWRQLRVFWPRAGTQPYPDVIAGSTTWSNAYKDFDFLLVYGMLLLLFAVFLAAAGVFNRLGFAWLEDRGEPMRRGPVAFWLGAALTLHALVLWLLRGTLPREALLGAGALVASVGLSHLWARFGLKVKELESFSREYLATLLLGAGLWFSGVGLFVLRQLFAPRALPAEMAHRLGVSALVLLGAVTVLSPILPRRWGHETWRRCVLGAQVLTPLLLLVLVRDAYQQGETITRLNVPGYTVLLLGAFVLVAMLSVGARCLKPPRGHAPLELDSLLTWPFVVAISVFLVHRQPLYSTLAFLDHFHLGELLVPWQQIAEYGQDFYFGFISLQWLLALVYGALNTLLFEGTAASFLHAFTLWPSLVVGLTAYLLHRVVGGKWALVLALFSLPSNDRHYLALPILLILMLPGLLARPVPWMLVWGGLSALHGLYNPSTGGALGVATLPFAGVMAWRGAAGGEWRRLWAQRRAWLVGGALGVGGVAAVSGRYLLGLVEFIRDNGSANATAYGISWFEYLQVVPEWFPWKFLVWDAVWIGGWLFGTVVLGCLSCRARLLWPRDSWEGQRALAVNLVGLFLLVLMIPYSMGRMDPGQLSRPGAMSLLAVGSLIPLGLALETRGRMVPGGLLLLVAMLLGFKSSLTYVPPQAQVLQQLAPLPVPEGIPLREGEQVGLPRLGRMFVPPDKLEELHRAQRVLGALLRPGETYFDLTNLSAYYYYLGYRVSSVYVADYTAIGAAAQKRILAALEREPPPLVWIGPRQAFDAGPASLRSYRLYRWLMRRGYVFHEREGLRFLVREERAAALGLARDEAVSRQGLASAFHLQDLRGLPVSWGQSFRSLRHHFARDVVEVAVAPSVSGAAPSRVWELPAEVRGAEFDFAALELECEGTPRGRARGQVFWAEAGAEFTGPHSFSFDARPGTLLLPMGSHPDWGRGAAVRRFRLDLLPVEGCQSPTVKDVRFLKLVD